MFVMYMLQCFKIFPLLYVQKPDHVRPAEIFYSQEAKCQLLTGDEQ